MVSLQERVKTKWLDVLRPLTENGIDIEGVKTAVENTLPAIIREEATEYARELWYGIVNDLQEKAVDEKDEKHVITNQFVENVYKELAEDLNTTIEKTVSETLLAIKELLREFEFDWNQTLKHLEAKLKEEKSVIESILAVEKRKFINEVFTRVIENIKEEMLKVLTGEAADLYASYVAQLVGNRGIEKIIISNVTPKDLVKELKREFGQEVSMEIVSNEDIVVLVDTGIAKLDVSPYVIVDDLVRGNLSAIRNTVLEEVTL